MVLACQRDSFLKEFKSRVVSCSDSKVSVTIPGTKEIAQGYEVILEDTIIFPEGGGQPSDRGFIDSARVLYVYRRGDQAIHVVDTPLEVGCEVKQIVDWERRLDHMQQHSGQHLISAIGEREFNYPTTAWWLGADTSYIEIEATSLNQTDIDRWEELVNQKIRAGLPVSVKVYEQDDPSYLKAHTRGLPEDSGPVRVVTIEDTDSNMCCGTHVKNLSELQVIKLLHFEKGKKKKVNLHFLVGGRVLSYLATALHRETSLTALLKNGPSYHVDLVEKLQKSFKMTNKKLQSVLKDLAGFEAQKLLALIPRPKYYFLHRKEGDSDFMRTFINEVGSQETLLFLTIGDGDIGHMMLFGEPSVVSELGPELCRILDGKGAGQGQRYQAKVSKLSRRDQAEQCIKEFLNK